LKFGLLFFILLINCSNPTYKKLSVEKLIPLTDLNTEYNDYNSAGPQSLNFYIEIIYSSDYPSKGQNFDICKGDINWYSYYKGENYEGEYLEARRSGIFHSKLVNSNSNEFGPYFINFNQLLFSSDRTIDSSDCSNDCNIYLYDYGGEYEDGRGEKLYYFFGNSDNSNEKYPSIGPDNYLYFASDNNIDNKYKIYRVKIDQNDDFLSWFTDLDNIKNIELLDNINSDGNSTCPYIQNDVMIFASDRDGGYGGYDIYYAYYINEKWTKSTNIGPLINSEFNEFRPSLYQLYKSSSSYFGKKLQKYGVIFSSDRDGGKGGFDLYFAMLKEEYRK